MRTTIENKKNYAYNLNLQGVVIEDVPKDMHLIGYSQNQESIFVRKIFETLIFKEEYEKSNS